MQRPSIDSVADVDLAQLERWALGYLERYATSAANLRRVLARRARRRLGGADRDRVRAAEALIEALVERYRDTRLVDDAAYAAARARRGLARGQSPARIAAGLAAKGVGGVEAAAAIAALGDGVADPERAAAIAFARRRRLGPFRAAPPADPEKQRNRELAAFARAGFARNVAAAVLACADHDAIAALLADSDGS